VEAVVPLGAAVIVVSGAVESTAKVFARLKPRLPASSGCSARTV